MSQDRDTGPNVISMLTKWHGYGNRNSAWVKLQLDEYEEHLNMNGAMIGQTLLGFIAYFSTGDQAGIESRPTTVLRSLLLPAMLDTAGSAGYAEEVTQANIFLGYAGCVCSGWGSSVAWHAAA
ncbi:uncharacterized protein Z518_04729 [Rhinocladiella mackenziei CBS 650.93]|uniref:Uncharacterized protein n=1 Tax=Rhinocladiella mackenziei CBS 650.93 TaxID=1442369 RepID=A0A0D2H8G3_9EURO|nr:uncharacterized protein Z518_04729 [Rhinocladiella mackenziei CBS 650.93]KIX06753.1 hypothetical protein Z518_04729 [Rhinocladiella mackenziei CBS 650.93]